MEQNNGKIVVVCSAGVQFRKELIEHITKNEIDDIVILDSEIGNPVIEESNNIRRMVEELDEEIEKNDLMYHKMIKEEKQSSKPWLKSNQRHPAFKRR